MSNRRGKFPNFRQAHKRKLENQNPGNVANKKPKGQVEHTVLNLSEVDAGMTEYVSNCPGFSGIIKQRFSDFIVNEIDLDDQEIHLKDKNPVILDVPFSETDIVSSDDFTDLITKDQWEALKALADTKSGSVEIDVSSKGKDERRQIHESIKKVYKNELTANTVVTGDQKIINVTFKTDTRKTYYNNKNRYVHFTLYKENIDTMDAVNLISRKLHLRPGSITYAGTKDKRAKTCQKMSLMNVKPSRIFNSVKSLRGLHADGFKFSSKPLKLGMLNGNRFQIVLRNVSADDEQIDSVMKSLLENGFLNYFGLQRFGTQSVPTFEIGKALLAGKWQEAVDLILKPRDGLDYPDLAKAREIWQETKDADAAFNQLTFKTSVEAQLLKGLKDNHRNDLVNALESIPRNTRLLYLHSYQSYIWNHVLSRRIKEFGFKPVVGDLVLADGCKIEDSECEPAEDNTKQEPSKLPNVVAITADDLDKYSIYDIVLPLPGFNVKYPENESFHWYNELFGKDGLSIDSMRQSVRKYSLGGAYRKLVCLPKNVSWKIMRYDDVTEPLVLSDLDIIEKKEVVKCPEGKYKALVLDFCLPSSVYATMALREVLKMDTSTHSQRALNPVAEVAESAEETAASTEEMESTEDTATDDNAAKEER